MVMANDDRVARIGVAIEMREDRWRKP